MTRVFNYLIKSTFRNLFGNFYKIIVIATTNGGWGGGRARALEFLVIQLNHAIIGRYSELVFQCNELLVVGPPGSI